MSMFYNARVVKLRSCHNEKYLQAVDDQKSVIQGDNVSTNNAEWTVESVPGFDSLIRLKSCYGKYLTASDEPFPIGLIGFQVHQTLPGCLDSSIEWEPIRGENQVVKLKNSRRDTLLKANNRSPPWRYSVTHKVPWRSSTNSYEWHLVIVATTEQPSISKPKDLVEMSMGELRKMAHAYYEKITNVDVLVSFEAFKQAMSSALMFTDFSYYMEQIGYDRKSGICSQKFFNELNEDRSGVLKDSDIKTLFYIVKGGIPLFCDGDCKQFLKVNSYFTCVNCFENGSEFSFNVCYNCYTGRMFVHHDHEDEGQPEAFLDPTVILNFIRAEKALKNHPAAHHQTSTNMNYQQSAQDAGTSSLPSSSTSTALVPEENPPSKKLKRVERGLALMQLLVSSGSLVAATVTCTVM